MTRIPSKSESEQMLKWLNENRHTLLDLYRNQYVAYNDHCVIAHSENLREVLELATASGETFAIYLVPRSTASIQILPIFYSGVVQTPGKVVSPLLSAWVEKWHGFSS